MISRLSLSSVFSSRTPQLQTIWRTVATSTEATPKEPKKKASTRLKDDPAQQGVTSARLARDLEEYFGPRQYGKIVDTFPSALLKRTQTAERFYFAAPQRAKALAKWITNGLEPDRLLVEVNPGMGLLTKELLKKTDNLMLYETEEGFESELNNLLVPENRKVPLRFVDFNNYWRHSYVDTLDQGGRVEKLLEGLPRGTRWKDEEVNFRLFSVIGSLQFFKSLINSVANQKGLFGLGRCEMVLAVPPLFFVHLTCRKDAGYKLYRSSSVLFQIFFEHEFIAKIPRKDFLPWPSIHSAKGRNQTQYRRLGLVGTDELYLMRVVPRRDLFDYCLPDNLRLLAFFVAQNMVSRKNRVIPALERWIPFSGARLILNQNYTAPSKHVTGENPSDSPTFQHTSSPLRENDFPERITIFTEFGELTPSQILTIFNEFISWPEFQQSPFLQSMEQHYHKQVYGGRVDSTRMAMGGKLAGSTGVVSGEEALEDDEEHLLGVGSDETDPKDAERTRT
ncbi:AAEL012582-PA [Aedes aegypti]|uniref:rRNA adenine N(6)-methyltransferase n=1 Tax=Aedes aegypti TaxID=7159 RepID=Q16LP3_AEDAE|nr:AAEL012582-PA [Aedes aegypti]